MTRRSHLSTFRYRKSAALLVSAAFTLTGVSAAVSAAPTPSPTWPAPGAGAVPSQGVAVSGRSGSIQLLRKPLVLVEQDVEKGSDPSFSVNTDVLFATGEHTLSPQAGEALDALVDQLTKSGLTGPADVIGHTDDVGSDASNKALSERRAKTVAARLKPALANTGITLTAKGVGESQPLASGSSERALSRNRRVSVVFTATSSQEPAQVDNEAMAVSVLEPAPKAPVSPAPPGSLVATQRSFTVGSASDRERWTVRLDITRAETIGPMLAVEVEIKPLTGPKDTFARTVGLFSGRGFTDDVAATALYDREAAVRLPPVVNGEGEPYVSRVSGAIDTGVSRHAWLMFPMPAGDPDTVELYIPAFGLLEVPVTSG